MNDLKGRTVDARFPRDARVRKRRDFLVARRRGRRLHTTRFFIDVARSPTGRRRLGVTVSRKVGNAVIRNRVKRWLREVYRQNQDLFPPKRDIVITAKRGFADFTYATIRDELIALFTDYGKASARPSKPHRSHRSRNRDAAD